MNRFKKSTLTTAIALVLCFTTLVVTAFAATQSLTSYETFKNSLLNLPSLENATIDGSVKLLDNGKEIAAADVLAKMQDQSTMSSKSNVTMNGESSTYEQWSNSEQTVWKDSDSEKYNVSKNFTTAARKMFEDGVVQSTSENGVAYSYSVVNIGGGNQTFDDLTAAEQKLIHAAIDLVMGDVKNYFTTNGNTISLNLEKNQIPQIVQLLVSVMAEKSSSEREFAHAASGMAFNVHSSDSGETYISVGEEVSADAVRVRSSSTGIASSHDDAMDVLESLPKFTDDTAVQSCSLDVTLDDSQNITAIKGGVTVVGTDVDGVSHTLALEIDLTVSDIGTTVADTIDLTGKEIEERFSLEPFISITGDSSSYTTYHYSENDSQDSEK